MSSEDDTTIYDPATSSFVRTAQVAYDALKTFVFQLQVLEKRGTVSDPMLFHLIQENFDSLDFSTCKTIDKELYPCPLAESRGYWRRPFDFPKVGDRIFVDGVDGPIPVEVVTAGFFTMGVKDM